LHRIKEAQEKREREVPNKKRSRPILEGNEPESSSSFNNQPKRFVGVPIKRMSGTNLEPEKRKLR